MAFTQTGLERTFNQVRGAFATFVYRTNDTIATVVANGYFNRKEFGYVSIDAAPHFVNVYASDGYYTVKYDFDNEVSSLASELVQKNYIQNQDKIRYFSNKLKKSLFEPCGITVVGNSLTEGFYANDALTTDNAAFRTRGYVAQARDRLANNYSEVGEGVIMCVDDRVVSVGATLNASLGITRQGGYRISNSGQTVTLTTPVCTEVHIHGWWESDAKCEAFTYSVDGGGDQTASISALGNDTDYTVVVSGLSLQVHTVVIKPAATVTKQVDIAGFSAFSDSSKGVQVNRLGKGGGYLSTMFYPTSDTGANPRSNRLTLGRTRTDLLVLAFGANESSVTGEGVGYTPAIYRAELIDLITYATDTFGCDVMFLTLGEQNPSQVGSFGEAAFYDIHTELSNSMDRVAHLNIRSGQFETYQTAVDSGMMIDNVHYNLSGHSFIGELIARKLSALD